MTTIACFTAHKSRVTDPERKKTGSGYGPLKKTGSGSDLIKFTINCTGEELRGVILSFDIKVNLIEILILFLKALVNK